MLSGIEYTQIFLGIKKGIDSDSLRSGAGLSTFTNMATSMRLKISLEAEASKFRLQYVLPS